MFICTFFLLVFSIVPFDWHLVGDFDFHFLKAGENCEGDLKEHCDVYFPLLHLLGSPFGFSKFAFGYFLLILLVFVTPMILFLRTRHWISSWLYFSATQYLYVIHGGAAYPQMLAGIFLLLFVWIKNPFVRLLLLIAGIMSHSQAYILLLVVWVLEMAFEYVPKLSFFPACSGVVGKGNEILNERVTFEVVNRNGLQVVHVLIKDIANFFIRTFPLPFLIMALYQVKKEKQYFIIAVCALAFYYGLSVSQARVFLVIPLLLLPFLTNFYKALSPNWKKAFILLSIVTFIINFGSWASYKLNCL